MNSYRCPYSKIIKQIRHNVNYHEYILDDKLDVAYTFDLVIPPENDTSAANVTAIKVKIADILPKKIQTGNICFLNNENFSRVQ